MGLLSVVKSGVVSGCFAHPWVDRNRAARLTESADPNGPMLPLAEPARTAAMWDWLASGLSHLGDGLPRLAGLPLRAIKERSRVISPAAVVG